MKGVIEMKIKPLDDRILIKRLPAEEVKQGGIIIPDTAKETPLEAEVVALGDGKLKEDGNRIPFSVKNKDRVLVGKYAGTDVKIDGEELVIIREEDILAKLEK